ncbi:SHOCT domain-containing protein [Candidatus Gottesmanbacteria bacterium]|nr:SHOCT domain-containing protein [Candidatus Gottesmanbacteria bacterium]
MKKLLPIIVLLFTLTVTPSVAFAQGTPARSVAEGMGNWTNTSLSATSDDHTASEEAEGKAIWDKLQAKQLACKNLTDDHYELLGEYFMGQSIGNTQRHAAMNRMMTNMMGEKGEEQMHIMMGKRFSGCDTGTKGGGNYMMGYGGWNNMMGGWSGSGILGWISMLLFWSLLILGVIALFRYLGVSGRRIDESKSPLDILKERYARGKIDKKEFEGMKKDLR